MMGFANLGPCVAEMAFQHLGQSIAVAQNARIIESHRESGLN